MGIFDIFTGAPAQEAAANTRNYLQGVQQQGTGAIQSGLASGVGAVGTGQNNSLAALGQQYGIGTGSINTGYQDAANALVSGNNNANNYYDQAAGAFGGLASKYGGATSLALDNLGVNGADAQSAARGKFQAGPAYNFNLEQGIDSISRLRNAQSGGNGMGGNADRDAQKFGAGLASNEYGNYMNQLLGFTNPELQATQGQSGVLSQQAGAANQYGQNQAGLSTERAKMLADLSQTYGQNQTGVNMGGAGTLAGLYSGAGAQQAQLGSNLATPYANTYGQEAAAQQQGSGNLWGLAQNIGRLGVGVYGINNGVRPPSGGY